MAGRKSGLKFGAVVLAFQVLFLVLFGLFAEYEDSANAQKEVHSLSMSRGGADPKDNELKHYYPMFQDVHVMIFIGFGFLMTFLKKYGYSAVSVNMLLAAFVIQWSMLMSGFIHLAEGHGKFHIGITNLLTSDFAAAAVLITFGALLGKTSPLQMVLIAFIEIIVFTINEWIGVELFKAVDMGGSMFVHAFGAYFGLALSRVLFNKNVEESKNEGAVYHSDLFSMIGTVFLWIFWPSFNAALAPGDDQHRAVINTYLALAACTFTTFAISAMVSKEAKMDMVHVQNATLAGGVAVGTSADMMIQPWGAMLIGTVAGVLSVVGFKFITPALRDKLKVHDTCGVNNLHGMPGVLAGIAGACAAALASTANYRESLYEIFPARAPADNTTELLTIQANFSNVAAGENRSASTQAGYQMAALAVTLALAVVSGALTGFLMKLPFWDAPKLPHHMFSDAPYWETPEDFNIEKIIISSEKKDALLADIDSHPPEGVDGGQKNGDTQM